MGDKEQAQRLADALRRCADVDFDGDFAAAAAMLERWPDAGEPVAWLVEGWHDGKLIAHIVHLTLGEANNSMSVFSTHYSTVHKRPLYADRPDQADRIGVLEAKVAEHHAVLDQLLDSFDKLLTTIDVVAKRVNG